MKRFLAAVLAATLLLSVLSFASAENAKHTLKWFIPGEVTTMDTGKVYDTISGEAVFLFS